jgi:hypothetical protein
MLSNATEHASTLQLDAHVATAEHLQQQLVICAKASKCAVTPNDAGVIV